jgi:hypothetical protein
MNISSGLRVQICFFVSFLERENIVLCILRNIYRLDKYSDVLRLNYVLPEFVSDII